MPSQKRDIQVTRNGKKVWVTYDEWRDMWEAEDKAKKAAENEAHEREQARKREAAKRDENVERQRFLGNLTKPKYDAAYAKDDPDGSRAERLKKEALEKTRSYDSVKASGDWEQSMEQYVRQVNKNRESRDAKRWAGQIADLNRQAAEYDKREEEEKRKKAQKKAAAAAAGALSKKK